MIFEAEAEGLLSIFKSESKAEQLAESLVNGNISIVREKLKRSNKVFILDFIRVYSDLASITTLEALNKVKRLIE